MACTVGDIAALMEQWAPAALAEDGDNVGLLAGHAGSAVQVALISLDVDDNVLAHAKAIGATLVIAHHPFIYRPLPAITDAKQEGRLVMLAIEAGIAIYAAHTNLDRAAGGVNDALCEAVGLVGPAPASIGSIGRLAFAPAAAALDEFARHVKVSLGTPVVRVTGQADRQILKVYVIPGAGRHDIQSAVNSGADCMLTGEIGYHDGQDALACNLCVVEAGHYHSERPILFQIEKHLQSEFKRLKYTVRTAVYEKSTCPFHHIS